MGNWNGDFSSESCRRIGKSPMMGSGDHSRIATMRKVASPVNTRARALPIES